MVLRGLAALLSLPLTLHGAVAPPAASPEPLVIRGVAVIDATGAPTRHGMTVVIRGGRIASVGAAEKSSVGPSARTLDGRASSSSPASGTCTST